MGNLFKQCPTCVHDTYVGCSSSFKNIFTPFPAESVLYSNGLSLCSACYQIIESGYSNCYDCHTRDGGPLGALSNLDFVGFLSPAFRYVKNSWKQYGRGVFFKPLGSILAEYLIENALAVDIISHVPSLSKIGGYDPLAWIISSANVMSERQLQTKYQLLTGILENNGGKEFKTLNRIERMESDRFEVGSQEEYIKGKRFLLIDDVYTTGKSIHNCGRLLLNAGASEVKAFIFARTMDKKHRSTFLPPDVGTCPTHRTS